MFFEYIGNILYALFIRRFSTKQLTVLVILAAIGLASFAVCNLSGYGHLGVGWSLLDYNLLGGFLRLLFAFSAGLLMSRIFKPVKIRGAFWICSIAIAVLLSIPHIGGMEDSWMNGIYDSVCTIILKGTSVICKFLGDISYPLYIVHYPFMYLYYAWLWSGEKLTFSDTWPVALVVFFGNILLAYLCLKLYDEPVRKWLTRKFLAKKQA